MEREDYQDEMVCIKYFLFIYVSSNQTLTKIPHGHVPKSHVITCDFGTCSCGIFVREYGSKSVHQLMQVY